MLTRAHRTFNFDEKVKCRSSFEFPPYLFALSIDLCRTLSGYRLYSVLARKLPWMDIHDESMNASNLYKVEEWHSHFPDDTMFIHSSPSRPSSLPTPSLLSRLRLMLHALDRPLIGSIARKKAKIITAGS